MTKYKNKCSSNNDALLEQGKLAYEWALDNMKIVTKIQNKNKKTKPLSGYKLGFCLHLTKETSVLLMAAKSLGATISICSANPLSVKEEIVEFLKYNEIEVFAKNNQKKNEFFNNLFKIISTK
ncbi:MAG TPA: adenosylhomocysteinase, partial [Nitrososphaeraceae archaeon]|nr:adenosylhomocysteinase [Nitrososphaeraceae archaeon]